MTAAFANIVIETDDDNLEPRHIREWLNWVFETFIKEHPPDGEIKVHVGKISMERK
jgi:hypothetical protein